MDHEVQKKFPYSVVIEPVSGKQIFAMLDQLKAEGMIRDLDFIFTYHSQLNHPDGSFNRPSFCVFYFPDIEATSFYRLKWLQQN